MREEPEIIFVDDWDYGEIRSLSHNAVVAAKLFGHKAIHGLHNGERIETASVVGFEGKYALLINGAKVELGEPKPDYIQFCKDSGCHVPTKEEPFKGFDISKEEWIERCKRIAKTRKEKGI